MPEKIARFTPSQVMNERLQKGMLDREACMPGPATLT